MSGTGDGDRLTSGPGGLGAWLACREPVPPPALLERVGSLALGQSRGDPVDSLLAAAEDALSRLVRDGATDRASALDLLAVDALVTYAFEAAARSPATIPAWSAEAMARLSAVARP